MPIKIVFSALLGVFSLLSTQAQFYTEIFSINQQVYQARSLDGQDSVFAYNQFVNLMMPIVRKNQDVFVFRGAYERLQSIGENECQTLTSLALPMGYNWTSRKNANWKYLMLGQIKLAGTWEQGTDWKQQIQVGGVFLATKTLRPELRWKMGLFVNKEAFGPFVIPLLGWDWKINERWKMIALLPSMIKLEYTALPKALNLGVIYRSSTRSFYDTPNRGFIRYNEMQLKTYLEYHFKSYYTFVEGGYFIGRSPRYFDQSDRLTSINTALYFDAKPFFLMNFGVAFRIAK